MANPVMNYNQFMAAFKKAEAGYRGKANVGAELFQTADATQLVRWAKSQSLVTLLSFMSANRDKMGGSGVTQIDNQFSSLFVQYEN